MLGSFLVFTLAACYVDSNGYDDCLDISGQSQCQKTTNSGSNSCKWYGRLNYSGACVSVGGKFDPKADPCVDITGQSPCDKKLHSHGCKWYGKKNHCVKSGGINDHKGLNNQARNPPKVVENKGFLAWIFGR